MSSDFLKNRIVTYLKHWKFLFNILYIIISKIINVDIVIYTHFILGSSKKVSLKIPKGKAHSFIFIKIARLQF